MCVSSVFASRVLVFLSHFVSRNQKKIRSLLWQFGGFRRIVGLAPWRRALLNPHSRHICQSRRARFVSFRSTSLRRESASFDIVGSVVQRRFFCASYGSAVDLCAIQRRRCAGPLQCDVRHTLVAFQYSLHVYEAITALSPMPGQAALR